MFREFILPLYDLCYHKPSRAEIRSAGFSTCAYPCVYFTTYIYIEMYVHYTRADIHAYIYMYINTQTHINTYIHTYVHTYIHTHIHTYVHTYIRTYIHKMYIYTTYTHIHIYRYTCVHVYMYRNTHTCTHTHTYYTYIHTYIHTYIYIYMQPPAPSVPTILCVCGGQKESHTFLFPVVYAFGYKFSSSRLQRILHHVCASKPLPPTQLRLLRHGFASICHLRARECFNYCRQSNSRCR